MQIAPGSIIRSTNINLVWVPHCVGQTLNPKEKGKEGGRALGTVVMVSIRVIVETDFFPESVVHFASETM